MSSFFLQQGLVIQRSGQILEYSTRVCQEIYFEEPQTGKRVTLTESEFWTELQTMRITVVDAFSSPKALLIPDEPPSEQIKSLSDLPKHHQHRTERLLQYIWALKKAGITRGQARYIKDELKRIACEINDPDPPGVSTIQRHWAKYERSNFDVFAVVSKNSDKKHTSPLNQDSENFLQKIIDEKYAVDKRPSISSTYRSYEKSIKDENARRLASGLPLLKSVCEKTFGNRINARPKEEIMIARLGREAARHYFKMIKGHLPAEHPLDVVEIDHTPMNLYVIDDRAYLPLGRPWLTAIKDRYSGVLLGFYISFQATGLQSVLGCIKHSLSSHHLAYALWPDIENPWPSFGLGATYLSDRGSDFTTRRYQLIIRELGADYEYCQKRTPWLKGSIERFFLTVEQTFFETIPGKTFANLQLRGDYKSEKDAVIRFSTLVYLLHKWAADFHNIFPNVRSQARPLDLWMDGIGVAPPPYPKSPDALNVILGIRHTGTLSHEGIRHAWMTYADDQLNDLMRDLGKGVKVDFVVNPDNLGAIHVVDPRSKAYFRVANTRPDYAEGLSSFQHSYLRKEARIRLKKETAVDTLIETLARITEVAAQELDARQTSTRIQMARVAGINSNAVLEGGARSILNPFHGQNLGAETVSQPEAISPDFTSVPTFKWGI